MKHKPLTPPDLIVHADWGSQPTKRWMCRATRHAGSVEVEPPEPVGDLETFWSRVVERANGGSALVGFDFPIGLPMAYARLAGVPDFRRALQGFGTDAWADFYVVCDDAAQISVRRPFYPFRPWGTGKRQLIEGLGLETDADLLRRCERATPHRGPAASLFWTLGAKQVGKAAIIGWRDLLSPALRDPSLDVALWPFDGSLAKLLKPGAIVVAETYPAEACVQVGIQPPGRAWSKTQQAGRSSCAPGLTAWAARRGVAFAPELARLVHDGFGPSKQAEDPFDALLGALSMIEVACGFRSDGVPDSDAVRDTEGWILGQAG